MKVAAIQMVSALTVPANLESARMLIEQAAREGAELAVLPEYFCLMGRRDGDKLAVRESDGGGTIQQFLAQGGTRMRAVAGGRHAAAGGHRRCSRAQQLAGVLAGWRAGRALRQDSSLRIRQRDRTL